MKIKSDYNLTDLNSFGLNVYAKSFLTINKEKELVQNLEVINGFKQHLILGGGSNVLFTQDFEGLVIKNNILNKTGISKSKTHCVYRFGAGETWHEVVQFCVNNNLGGIENLSLIPGTVGAAPIQNIGAYGVEIKNVFVSLRALELKTGKIIEFSNAECDFGYRNSVFKQKEKGKFFILSVDLRLTTSQHHYNTSYGDVSKIIKEEHNNEINLKSISAAIIKIRQSKLPDPAKIGNAGSFFKNPYISEPAFKALRQRYPKIPGYPSDSEVKVPAGWLIEQCHWKGKTIQDRYGVHKKQALVLVNYGTGTGTEIFQLAGEIIASVKEKFGITLQPEVNIL